MVQFIGEATASPASTPSPASKPAGPSTQPEVAVPQIALARAYYKNLQHLFPCGGLVAVKWERNDEYLIGGAANGAAFYTMDRVQFPADTSTGYTYIGTNRETLLASDFREDPTSHMVEFERPFELPDPDTTLPVSHKPSDPNDIPWRSPGGMSPTQRATIALMTAPDTLHAKVSTLLLVLANDCVSLTSDADGFFYAALPHTAPDFDFWRDMAEEVNDLLTMPPHMWSELED